MARSHGFGWYLTGGLAALVVTLVAQTGLATVHAQQAAQTAPAAAPAAPAVTFTKDIAPILQRSCQNCHRPGQVAPMSLLTYEDARPWARAIRQRTSIRDKAGAMPPWYIEKNIGIQQLKHDPSLSDEEVAKIARWVDAGAPRGNPADMPPPLKWADDSVWSIGTPDLIVESPEILVKANSPDWWGELEPVKIPLDEDRYVAAIEMKEVNDIPSGDQGRETVGARYVFHHLIWSAAVLEEGGELPESQGLGLWPVHEVGRNADVFDPRAGRELKANSSLIFESTHLHSNGRDTKARLRFGFKLHPKGYKPDYRSTLRALGNGLDIDIKPNEANQQLHAYLVLERPMKVVTFEPHLHAPGARMCLEYIWGINIQTLSCSGYDHNWVRQYEYEDDYAPLLPKGTILHITGYMDNTEKNKNIPDPRNWQGSGNRSIANMFIDLGQSVYLTEEQFQDEMAKRREKRKMKKNDYFIDCPLCGVPPPPKTTTTEQRQQQD
ncbi:MAG TPA: cytochrome c [Vicinamibacterales bacterium]|nr:cytochrome c [Vicinamibacterales bacterium]